MFSDVPELGSQTLLKKKKKDIVWRIAESGTRQLPSEFIKN